MSLDSMAVNPGCSFCGLSPAEFEACFWREGKHALLEEMKKGHSLESHRRERCVTIYRWLSSSRQG